MVADAVAVTNSGTFGWAGSPDEGREKGDYGEILLLLFTEVIKLAASFSDYYVLSFGNSVQLI